MATGGNHGGDEPATFDAVATVAIVETIVVVATLIFVAALIVPSWLVPSNHARLAVAHPHLTAIDFETAERRHAIPSAVATGPVTSLPRRDTPSVAPPAQPPLAWQAARCVSSGCGPSVADEDSDDRDVIEQAAKDDDARRVSPPDAEPASDVQFIETGDGGGGSSSPSIR